MKRFFDRYFPLLPIALVIILSSLGSHSCANTTEAPTGGEKDTIPPVIVKVFPEMYSKNVPTTGAKFYFGFNEYVKVKNQQNIFVSPPLSKAPKTKLYKKGIYVWFECDLDSNTTYTLDFTDAIADNNEGNVFPGFTYVFSTGSEIDSMMVTGTVRDCNTLMPLKGATVMMYTDLADSAVFLSRPYAAAKTDDWGYFSIRNIKDTLYRMYAIVDANNDNIYDPQSERIAFLDTVMRPSIVVSEDSPELQKYEMTDTVACLARKSEYSLNVFRERPTKQFISNSGRLSDRAAFIAFMAPDAHIDTMWIRGVKYDRLITQFNIERDSLELWVNDRRDMPDTFHLFVNYRKTDSLGVPKPFTEEVELVNPISRRARRAARKDLKHEDTTCVFKLNVSPETFEMNGYEIMFDYPIINESFDSLSLTVINPRQQESKGTFKVESDTLNPRRYVIRPTIKIQEGYEYFLKVPHRAFRDINGHYSDSTEVKVKLPSDETLSSLKLDISGVGSNTYIVDFLNEKRSTVLLSYVLREDRTVTFPYLKAGTYYIRITEDRNANGIVDTGSVLEHRQSEKVKFYMIGDGEMIVISESVDLEQSLDLNTLFGDGTAASAPSADDLAQEGTDALPDPDFQYDQTGKVKYDSD